MKLPSLRSLFHRYPIVAFFVLSYVFAWSTWIGVGLFIPNATTALILPGAWAPTIAALIITALLDGRAGVRVLLRSVLRWRVALHWYLIAAFGPTMVALVAILGHVLLGGTAPSLATIAARFGLASEDAVLLFALMPFIFIGTIFAGGPIAEELGWRGFAQRRLQACIGPARAGVVIGLLWALWHLPLFFVLPLATGNIPFGWYVPLVTAFGVLFGWLYNHGGGSVLLCIILHTGINFVVGALGLVNNDPQLLVIFVVLMCAAAVVVGARMQGVTAHTNCVAQPGDVGSTIA
jgi:hypothetical protein